MSAGFHKSDSKSGDRLVVLVPQFALADLKQGKSGLRRNCAQTIRTVAKTMNPGAEGAMAYPSPRAA
jgi:hypothetical protein